MGRLINAPGHLAFGVVLYELLTGKMLFGGGETVTDTLASVVKDVPDLNALPPGRRYIYGPCWSAAFART